eukprot:scaffold10069_cov69-Cylindrotheca_fusiformis.AAC.10
MSASCIRSEDGALNCSNKRWGSRMHGVGCTNDELEARAAGSRGFKRGVWRIEKEMKLAAMLNPNCSGLSIWFSE